MIWYSPYQDDMSQTHMRRLSEQKNMAQQRSPSGHQVSLINHIRKQEMCFLNFQSLKEETLEGFVVPEEVTLNTNTRELLLLQPLCKTRRNSGS